MQFGAPDKYPHPHPGPFSPSSVPHGAALQTAPALPPDAGGAPQAANGAAALSPAAASGAFPDCDDDSSSSSSDGDRDSAASAVATAGGGGGGTAAHLRHCLLGFERGGVLGRWLRAMWAGEASLRPRLDELAQRYTDVLTWRRRLGAVCAAAGKWGWRAGDAAACAAAGQELE
jgi:hypothetical protein